MSVTRVDAMSRVYTALAGQYVQVMGQSNSLWNTVIGTADSAKLDAQVMGATLPMLHGETPTANYSNLWDAALLDDVAFSEWSDLADQTASAAQRVLNLTSKYDISGTLAQCGKQTFTNLANAKLPDILPSSTSITVWLVLIAVIVIGVVFLRLS